jgi:hypothetical protein
MLRLTPSDTPPNPAAQTRHTGAASNDEPRDVAIPTPREILQQTADALERTLQAPAMRSEWYIG